MYLPAITFLFFTLAYAAINDPCHVPGRGSGVCVTTQNCARDGGTSTRNYCPNDPDNVRCCTKAPCGPSGQCGSCMWTSDCTPPTWRLGPVGECPGPAGFRCCLPRPGLC
ncbi:hypothetical protein P167DRAFT_513886 [Morchella conica CCBAS932]|uniref:Uncharacterized protein n=1 Tax=Morchella conica CCBAS932 TaxID=1392247 RepID=A0A3N4KMR6_9PEZI|nr:hypothetical protein P167DRAFT_513886 [Morchella conica CCBAS932]